MHTSEVLEFQDHLNELYDPEIINWCKNNSRTWITHDFNARRKHIEVIKLARINVVWIRINTKQNIVAPNESATWRIFKVIVRTIDGIQNHIFSSHGALHFKIHLKSGKSPTIDWAENSKLDMPTQYR